MRLLLELWSICGDRLADAVRWTEAERLSGLYGKTFRKSKRRSVVTGSAAPTGVGSGGPAGAGGVAGAAGGGALERAPRRLRADAQRNIDSLLEAAKAVFGTSGVDAPAKEIADLAGVGVGTLYRHFPQRSDLVKAVFQRGVDACADAAPALAAAHEPGVALARWLLRYTEFLATKRGLANALHSGDPAFDALPGYFMQRLGPVLGSLLDAATASGEIRADISPEDLLHAVANLCQPVADDGAAYSQRMVALLIDGLRYGADLQRS
jgi:AcrR family transcriptional regulator